MQGAGGTGALMGGVAGSVGLGQSAAAPQVVSAPVQNAGTITEGGTSPAQPAASGSGNTANGNVGTTTTNNSATTGTDTSPSPLQDQFNQALNQITGYYNTILGQEPGAYGSALNTMDQGYSAQQGNLNNSYSQAQSQVPWQLIGRGAGNSSWADNALGYANNAYNNSTNQLTSAETQSNDQLQKQEDTDMGEANQWINQGAPELASLFPNLSAYYQNAQLGQMLGQEQQLAGQTAGNLPVSQLGAQMAANPIYAQGGQAQIQGLEAQLANTGAPSAVQQQILAGLAGNPNNPVIPNILTNLQPPSPVTPPAGS